VEADRITKTGLKGENMQSEAVFGGMVNLEEVMKKMIPKNNKNRKRNISSKKRKKKYEFRNSRNRRV
jgi:hypothetical protein